MRFVPAFAALFSASSPLSAQADQPAECQWPYIIYFESNSDALNSAAKEVLDAVAILYRTCGPGSVTVMGHTDRSTEEDESVGLSQRMASAVREYLAGLGVPEMAMTTMAFGESRPALETEDGVKEPLNRRVEIVFGPGSGW